MNNKLKTISNLFEKFNKFIFGICRGWGKTKTYNDNEGLDRCNWWLIKK